MISLLLENDDSNYDWDIDINTMTAIIAVSYHYHHYQNHYHCYNHHESLFLAISVALWSSLLDTLVKSCHLSFKGLRSRLAFDVLQSLIVRIPGLLFHPYCFFSKKLPVQKPQEDSTAAEGSERRIFVFERSKAIWGESFRGIKSNQVTGVKIPLWHFPFGNPRALLTKLRTSSPGHFSSSENELPVLGKPLGIFENKNKQRLSPRAV